METDHPLYKSISILAIGTAAILLIPFIAMQYTDEVSWTAGDFVFAGSLLFGSGLAYKLISRKSKELSYRIAVGIAIAVGCLIILINAAVGIIGSESHPANIMYAGVLGIGTIGALLGRLRPKWMAYTLYAMALAQLSVPVIALIIWPPHGISWGEAGVFRVFIFNVFFALLFLASGLLFRYAGKKNRKLSNE